jgi:hypothetical protein
MSERIERLLTRLRKGIAGSREVFESLDHDEWEIVLYHDPYPWTLRDLLAHFVSAEEGLLWLAQDVAAGGDGAPEGFDYQAFNASEQERLTRVPTDQLMTALVAARQRTISWVEELEDAALDRVGRHPVLGEVSVETFVNAVYGHQLMHVRDLKRALD